MQTDLKNRNFGLSGLSHSEYEDFDDFLGIGKKARKRRKEKRFHKKEKKRLKRERKTLKNDERRAKTEALRSETQLSTQILNSPSPIEQASQAHSPSQPPLAGNAPLATASFNPNFGSANTEDKSITAGNTPLIVVGVLAIGGLAYAVLK